MPAIGPLPAFLDGKHEPQGNDERLALLGVCQFTDRTRASARLYADAFAADPRLADDLRAGHRDRAARAAALAGCGCGADSAGLGEGERARWRAQARAWPRADLAAWGKSLDSDPAAVRNRARQQFTQWQTDRDLAGLRDPAELDGLPPDERRDCAEFWGAVAAAIERCGPAR